MVARIVGWVKAQTRTLTAAVGRRPLLESVDRLRLGPQHTLHMVRARGRLLLVSVHPHGSSLVADLGAAREKRTRRERPCR
ncbi:MAG: flagellar biosynthetic protein FliO [Bryobacteraceae bacterium]|nr:flagellar biosynthetic protein FliO [Bryobacteraceae bacterium]